MALAKALESDGATAVLNRVISEQTFHAAGLIRASTRFIMRAGSTSIRGSSSNWCDPQDRCVVRIEVVGCKKNCTTGLKHSEVVTYCRSQNFRSNERGLRTCPRRQPFPLPCASGTSHGFGDPIDLCPSRTEADKALGSGQICLIRAWIVVESK
jgi:hypothetical protein